MQYPEDFFKSTLFKCIASFVGQSEVCRKGSKIDRDLQLLDFFVQWVGTGQPLTTIQQFFSPAGAAS